MGQLCAKPALGSVDVTVNDVDLLPEQPPETPSAGGAPGTSDSPRRTSHSISSGKADGSHFRVKSVVYIIGDLPWLLKDLAVKTSDFAGLTEGAEVPPNPVDGPSIAVVSAQVLKERGFGFYVAISADVEGDGNFTYVARTATANPVNVLAPHFTLFSGLTGAGAVHWQEEVHLGAAALAWGPKTKLKFLVIEDHTYGHVGTHKDLALSICRLTDLRSSGGIHDLLLEDESGYPVLAGAGTARSPLAPAFLSVRFSEAEVMRMTRRWSGFVADAAHPLAASDAESNSNIVVEPSSIEALDLGKRSNSSSSLMASVLSTLSGSTVRRRPPHAAAARVAARPPPALLSLPQPAQPGKPQETPLQHRVRGAFPRHVFMMTRGTRGDVQPFVALARGLCNEFGWLVTICTEASFREFVVQKCGDITNGAVQYLCSGGDTEVRTQGWLEQKVMSAQTEGAPRRPRRAAPPARRPRPAPPPHCSTLKGAALLMPALWSPEPHCGRSPPCDGHPGPRLSHARGCPGSQRRKRPALVAHTHPSLPRSQCCRR